MDEQERLKHLDMINNPDKWPVWPFLPLIRMKDKSKGRHLDNLEMGVIYILQRDPYYVFLDLLLLFQMKLKVTPFGTVANKTPYIEYKYSEEIVNDGWMVD